MITQNNVFKTAILIICTLCLVEAVQAQDSNYDDLRDQLKKEYFSVGTLLQVVGDYQFERSGGENGFSLGNARFQVSGELDQKFGYQLQADFIKTPSVLDANMYYNVTSSFSVKAGLFKSPFSYEFLTGAAAIDFVNRSTVVNQLVPNRQIGLQLGGTLADGKFLYKAGIFNGNGLGRNQNSDDQLLYVGRLEGHLSENSESGKNVIVGLNASYEQKEQVSNTGNLRSTFQGDQLILGADTRFERGPFMISGEFIYGSLTSDVGVESNPFGYYATASYFFTPETQVLVRWDRFEGDNIGRDSEAILAGINYFPSSFSEIQFNYIYPVDDDIEFSQILLNLQIGF